MFKHPYYAVTNEKGEFEIKDAHCGQVPPAGLAGELRLRSEEQGRPRRGITIEDKKTTEVKPIEIKKED